MGWGDAADPSAPRAGGSGPANCTVVPCGCVKMQSLSIRSLEFVGDHGVLTDYRENFKPGGQKFPKPEWGDKASHPVSYSMGQYIEVFLTFDVAPANACPETGDLIGEGPQGIFFELKNVTFIPGTNRVFMIAKKALAQKVQILDFEVLWRAERVSAKFGFFDDVTKNRIYVTYDKPYNDTPMNNTVTEKRLEWLCSLTSGDTNGHDSMATIHKKGGKYAVGALKPKSHWDVAGGVQCECIDLSKFYMLASRMLGLRTGNVVFVYPTPGKGTKESSSTKERASRPVSAGHSESSFHGYDRPDEKLVLIDHASGWNNYEACFKFEHPNRAGKMTTRYYAGGAGAYDTAAQVMSAVCKLTQWTYYSDDRRYNMGEGENICKDPGPSPVDTWNFVP